MRGRPHLCICAPSDAPLLEVLVAAEEPAAEDAQQAHCGLAYFGCARQQGRCDRGVCGVVQVVPQHVQHILPALLQGLQAAVGRI